MSKTSYRAPWRVNCSSPSGESRFFKLWNVADNLLGYEQINCSEDGERQQQYFLLNRMACCGPAKTPSNPCFVLLSTSLMHNVSQSLGIYHAFVLLAYASSPLERLFSDHLKRASERAILKAVLVMKRLYLERKRRSDWGPGAWFPWKFWDFSRIYTLPLSLCPQCVHSNGLLARLGLFHLPWGSVNHQLHFVNKLSTLQIVLLYTPTYMHGLLSNYSI